MVFGKERRDADRARPAIVRDGRRPGILAERRDSQIVHVHSAVVDAAVGRPDRSVHDRHPLARELRVLFAQKSVVAIHFHRDDAGLRIAAREVGRSVACVGAERHDRVAHEGLWWQVKAVVQHVPQRHRVHRSGPELNGAPAPGSHPHPLRRRRGRAAVAEVAECIDVPVADEESPVLEVLEGFAKDVRHSESARRVPGRLRVQDCSTWRPSDGTSRSAVAARPRARFRRRRGAAGNASTHYAQVGTRIAPS